MSSAAAAEASAAPVGKVDAAAAAAKLEADVAAARELAKTVRVDEVVEKGMESMMKEASIHRSMGGQ